MSTTMKHTPGPWNIDWYGWDDNVGEINGPDGNRITEIDSALTDPEDNGRPEKEHRANAHLIAAAPELLAMLKAANAAFYVKGTRNALLAALDGSRDLIRKASGETPAGGRISRNRQGEPV